MKLNPLPKWLAYAAGIVAIVNFGAFVLIAESIGGDALNGHAVQGHYFLSNHGRLIEVSRATFEYSKWHAISLFVTHPLAIFIGWKWMQQKKASQPQVKL
jgi:hypothetical protein